jgi:hypothetical protein
MTVRTPDWFCRALTQVLPNACFDSIGRPRLATSLDA